MDRIRNRNDLALTLHCRVEDLNNAERELQRDDAYLARHYPKRRGGSRRILRPANEINRNLQKKIQELIGSAQPSMPEYVHGFVKGRSARTNAEAHLNKKHVLTVDIKDFFGSIGPELVRKVFRDLGANDEIAELLTILCTFENGLPQGVHTSPVISNLAFREVDVVLADLAEKNGCTYTRYVDDLTFSSDDPIEFYEDIKTTMGEFGFTLNEKKTRFQKRGYYQYVTGLSVSNEVMPRVPRRVKKNLRLELYYINKYGMNSHQWRTGWAVHPFYGRNIEGRLAHIHSIEPKVASKLFKVYAEAMEKEAAIPFEQRAQERYESIRNFAEQIKRASKER